MLNCSVNIFYECHMQLQRTIYCTEKRMTASFKCRLGLSLDLLYALLLSYPVMIPMGAFFLPFYARVLCRCQIPVKLLSNASSLVQLKFITCILHFPLSFFHLEFHSGFIFSISFYLSGPRITLESK